MPRIVIWYHCVIRGSRIPNGDVAFDIVAEQMNALIQSGLSSAASEIHIGINGTDSDGLTVACVAPVNSQIHINHGGESELATMRRMRESLQAGMAIFYHHCKGVQHDPRSGFHNWRRSMERVSVWDWRTCVQMLDAGYDTCGCHWFTQRNGALPGQRYWPGNFWWAKSEHLMTLPPFKPDHFDNRYEAEDWIGKSPMHPRHRDLWPNMPLG